MDKTRKKKLVFKAQNFTLNGEKKIEGQKKKLTLKEILKQKKSKASFKDRFKKKKL